MSVDSVGNFLTAIRNAIKVYKRSITVPFSKLNLGVAEILKQEGFIKDVAKVEGENNKHQLVIHLKYVDGESVIHEITRISTPGRRYYEGVGNMTSVIGGLGVSVLTTSSGIMTDKQAKRLSVGGEVLCHIW